MGMFRTREPRKFHRVSIYTNDRKDKLDKLVRDVKREMGELPQEDNKEIPSYKGRFSEFTPRASQRGVGRRLKWPILMIFILLLILAWRFIITGKLSF